MQINVCGSNYKFMNNTEDLESIYLGLEHYSVLLTLKGLIHFG